MALLWRSGYAGVVLQTCYYGVIWLLMSPEARADDERWSKVWSAMIVSTAAFAFSAYAMRFGILT